MSERVSTQIKCSDCGKTATVPFKPSADKPVYCRDCLAKHRTSGPRQGNPIERRSSNPDSEKNAWSRRRGNWK